MGHPLFKKSQKLRHNLRSIEFTETMESPHSLFALVRDCSGHRSFKETWENRIHPYGIRPVTFRKFRGQSKQSRLRRRIRRLPDSRMNRRIT